MSDIYKTPSAELSRPAKTGAMGSVEKAIAGDYEFGIGQTLQEAWEKTKGRKWMFHKIFAVYFLASVLVMSTSALGTYAMSAAGIDPNRGAGIAISIGIQLAYTIALLPLGVGLMIAGVRSACDTSISSSLLFRYFSKIVPLAITLILSYVLILAGLMLLVIPGIYLMNSYLYATTLVVEKNMGPWQAMETSRKAITHNWFGIFGFWIVMIFIFMASVIPLGIGLVWTFPMMIIAMGVIYRDIFGCETETLQ